MDGMEVGAPLFSSPPEAEGASVGARGRWPGAGGIIGSSVEVSRSLMTSWRIKMAADQ